MSEAVVRDPVVLPTGRLLAVDDEGNGLRATWHLDRGFVNLSLWHEDRCVETFHLSIEDAGRLTGFLVDGFAQVTSAAIAPGRPGEPGGPRLVPRGEDGTPTASGAGGWLAPWRSAAEHTVGRMRRMRR